MDWIKVLNRHVMFEYNDLSDSEFRAWIKIMSLSAFMEAMPTHDQIVKHVHHKTLTSLQDKLKTHSTTLQDVLKKVLIDAQGVVDRKKYWKDKKKEYRERDKNVHVDIQGKAHVEIEIDKEKEIEKEIKKKKATPPRKKLTDEEWLESLKSNIAYANLDILKIKGKCEAWCNNKQKIFTRARFLNWLNREEIPMGGPTNGKPSGHRSGESKAPGTAGLAKSDDREYPVEQY
jgi:hypothetical protein